MRILILIFSILLLSSCTKTNDIECIKVGEVYIEKICVMKGLPYGYTISGEAKNVLFQEPDGWASITRKPKVPAEFTSIK